MFRILQHPFRSGTEAFRRCAVLAALVSLVLCQSARGQVVSKGEAVATTFSGTCDGSTGVCTVVPTNHVIAVIDVRNRASAGIQPGTNWSSTPEVYPSSGAVSGNYPGDIVQVPGTCDQPITMPDGGNPANPDGNGNKAGGSNSILCYPPNPTSGNGLIPPSGSLTVNSSYVWNAAMMGQVFGVALDNEGDIFTTASSVYGDFIRSSATTNLLGGLVFRIDRLTGLVTPFIAPCASATFTSACKTNNQIPNTNGVGLGNIAFDPVHQQLLVTNFEDGLIYRLTGLSGPTGTIVGSPYGPFDNTTYNKQDEGTPGFADPGLCPSTLTAPCTIATPAKNQGRRLWAIGAQVQNGTACTSFSLTAPCVRVYFSVWAEDQYSIERFDSSGAEMNNKIWSFLLDAAGGFTTALTTLRDESKNGLVNFPLNSPHLDTSAAYPSSSFLVDNSQPVPNSGNWSNPVSDIEFSSAGNILVAERTMWRVYNGDYGSLSNPSALDNPNLKSSLTTWVGACANPACDHSAAHDSRVMEWVPNGSGGWTPGSSPLGQYYVGYNVYSNYGSSSGGADYGYNDYPESCEQRVWMTCDFCTTLTPSSATSLDVIYGLESTKAGNWQSTDVSSVAPFALFIESDYFVDLNNLFPGLADKTTIGDVAVYRDPCSNCFIEVCKSAANSVTGNFTFTATSVATPPDLTSFTSGPLVVPAGYCTGTIPVACGTVVVTETATPFFSVSAITAEFSSSLDSLVSTNLPGGSATLMLSPPSEAVVDFTNQPMGQLKICKIAGPGVGIGTLFPFTATGSAGNTQSYRVPAGPPSEGGYCVVDNSAFPGGTAVKVAELTPASEPAGCLYTLTGVTINVDGTPIASPTITNGMVPVTIGAGFTEVVFTNGVVCSGQGRGTDAPGAGRIGIVSYSLVSQSPSGGAESFMTYRADLLNTGATIPGPVVAMLTSLDPSSVQVVGRGELNFASSPANIQVASSNTFTILTKAGVPLDLSKLKWTFQSTKELPPAKR